MMSDFVHLHLHSEYSLMDSTIKLDRLLARVEELNMNACAITDSGNMFGAATFYFAARERGIKPIIGSELFVAPGSRFSQAREERRPRPHHLVLIAYNNAGYKNLMKLSSLSYLEGYYYGPRIDKELLAKYSEGLICLTGCLNGEIPWLTRQGSKKNLYAAVEEYLAIFGERLYFELQDNGYKIQRKLNERLVTLSKQFRVPLVATNNCHYLEKNELDAYEILIAIRKGKKLDKMSFARVITENSHLRSAQEMEQVFSNYPEALKNTLRVAEMSNISIDTGTYHFPDPLIPPDMDIDEYFVDVAQRGLNEKLPIIRSTYVAFDDDLNQKYAERLTYELNVLKGTGFHSNLLLVADYTNWAKSNGIPVGPGRGSMAGSLVAYCLGITDIDPMRHDLLFERFLNPVRITVPDIDIDLCVNGRDDVINYIAEKQGKDRFTHIITFGSMYSRAAVRCVATALGMQSKKVNSFVELIPNTRRGIAEALEQEPELMKIYQREKRVKEVLDNARILEGIVYHTSTHAAGIVISDSNLMELVPLCRDRNDNTVTQYDARVLEKLGLLKFDFLGLETLTLINEVTKCLADRGIGIDISRINLEDERTYDLLSVGDTLGIFQLESKGMRDILVKIKPSRFSDIAALIALYRPGPLESGMVDEFISRKNDPSFDKHECSKLADILQDTYGLIVYQEQIMKIATILAGFSTKEADAFRRAMSKETSGKYQKYKKQFIDGAVGNDVPRDVAERIYGTIMRFGKYGFNKTHAIAYGLIAYRTAYLKSNHYKEFMSTHLTFESYNADKMQRLIKDCERHGIHVLPLDINKSECNFTVEGNHIRFGFVGVEDIDAEVIERILDTRRKIGKFESWKQFKNAIDLKSIIVKNLRRTIRASEQNQIFNP